MKDEEFLEDWIKRAPCLAECPSRFGAPCSCKKSAVEALENIVVKMVGDE